MLHFTKFCQKYGIPYLEEGGHHHAGRGWVQTHCPFCSGGRGGWHLGYSVTGGNFNCWRCGPLAFRSVVGALLKTNDAAAISRAVAAFQRDGPKRLPKERKATRRAVKPPPGVGPLLRQHRRYLAGRGYDPDDLAAEWGVQGTAHLSGPWSWRVVVPVYNAAGDVVAYQGRAIKEGAEPKYRMTADADCAEDPDDMIYGIHRATGDAVVVVEGVTGVWRIGPGAVATFGIDWSRAQANAIRKFKRRYVLFDPEPLAQERAEELAAYLGLFPGVTEIISGYKTDPGDMTPRQAAKLRRRLGV